MTSEPATLRALRRRRWRIVIGCVLVVVLLVVVSWSTVFRMYVNDGEAMLPTLASGDRLLVNRLASPGVDDLVIVTVDGAGGTRQLVKRIVAVGGDTIAYVGCRLTRNGAPVDGYETIDEPCVGDFAETEVPDGTVFLLGDNRPASSDSRMFGPVQTGAVIGVVTFTL